MRHAISEFRRVKCLDCDALSSDSASLTARAHANSAGHTVTTTHERTVTYHGEAAEPANPAPSAEKAFGELVRRARERLGMTQEDVRTELTRAGVQLEKTAYSRLEAGKRPIRLNEVFALTALLDIDSKGWLPS